MVTFPSLRTLRPFFWNDQPACMKPCFSDSLYVNQASQHFLIEKALPWPGLRPWIDFSIICCNPVWTEVCMMSCMTINVCRPDAVLSGYRSC